MTDFGLTPAGFVPKTLDDVLSEIQADERAAFGASLDLGSGASVFDNLNGVMADRLSELWDVAQAVNAADDPDGATNTSLDAVCAITGTLRDPSRSTTVTATLTGTPGTLVAAGREVSVVSVGTKFATSVDATIAALVSWLTITTYAIGDRRTHGGQCYVCTVGGVSGATGPVGTLLNLTESDGTVTWKNIGGGSGAVDVEAAAETVGPLLALTGTLTTIETPVSGWTNVNNLVDALPGADVEQDPALRARRENETVAEANATVPAIRTKLLLVGAGTNTPVTSVRIFQNTDVVTDGEGHPPKSIEALVLGGVDQDIGNALFAAAGAGIETYGNVSVTVTDSIGTSWVVKFSRPTQVTVWVILHVLKDPSVFAATGEQDIIDAVVAAGLLYAIGKDAVASAIGKTAWVPGVLDTGLPFIGTSASPATSVTIACGDHDLAVFDSSRVSVVLTDGEP